MDPLVAISRELASLSMGDARVTVEVAQPEGQAHELCVDGARLSATGIDRVEFLIAPNRGEDPQPLRKIASGGELSRAMLALGHITASSASVGAGHSAAAVSAAALAAASQGAAEAAGWQVPVVSCVSTRDEGVAEVVARLAEHRHWLATPEGLARKRERLKEELFGRVREALSATLLDRHRAEVEAAAEQVARGELDLYAATAALVSRWT